jgi:ankyrin repeat protein
MAYAPIARFEYLLQKDVLLEPWIEKLALVAVEGRNISLLRWLLTKGLAIDDGLGDGHTPLTLTSEVGDANMVSFLLRHGADVNQQNRRTRFGPLGFATLYDHSLVTRVLLENGADPNDTNRDSVTALGRAVRACDGESIRLLLEYGADPRIADKRGDMPVDRVKSCLDRGVWTEDTSELVLLRRASAN